MQTKRKGGGTPPFKIAGVRDQRLRAVLFLRAAGLRAADFFRAVLFFRAAGLRAAVFFPAVVFFRAAGFFRAAVVLAAAMPPPLSLLIA
jgi:hypothetical protein